MIVLSDVSYTDKVGKIWAVPAGTRIDGASIPPALWTFAGSPFVGNYRRASVIHDCYCDTKTEFSSDVNKMFREAMETDGVGYWEALSKYLAVSAYTSVTGACGKAENALDKLYSLNTFEGLAKSDELFKQLDAFQSGVGNLDIVSKRIDTINAIAEVANPRTFAALSEFRRVPSEDNFKQLETAIEAERPTDIEADQLILLANATVPEGSIELPAK